MSKDCARDTWLAACRRLAKMMRDGSLVLESRKGELRFRYVREPRRGFVIRQNGRAYAAIVAKSDWPAEVPLFRLERVA